MPVDNHPIHALTQHATAPAGCHNRLGMVDGYITTDGINPDGTYQMVCIRHTMSHLCRQIGRRTPQGWAELPECAGCLSPQDTDYINKSRAAIDSELSRFMRADQRII